MRLAHTCLPILFAVVMKEFELLSIAFRWQKNECEDANIRQLDQSSMTPCLYELPSTSAASLQNGVSAIEGPVPHFTSLVSAKDAAQPLVDPRHSRTAFLPGPLLP